MTYQKYFDDEGGEIDNDFPHYFSRVYGNSITSSAALHFSIIDPIINYSNFNLFLCVLNSTSVLNE